MASAIYASGPDGGAASQPAAAMPMVEPEALLDQYCSRCHNDFDLTADLSIEDLNADDVHQGVNTEVWEKILRQVGEGHMPPSGRDQPDPLVRASFVDWLGGSLDAYAMAHPDPGRATVRRLNRVEYANAVRDLLDLNVDFSGELPQDNSGFGFDNIADVLSVSPTLMERYIAAAGKIGPMATGLSSRRELVTTYQVPKDGSIGNSGVPAYNERSSDLLPLGSRGGVAVHEHDNLADDLGIVFLAGIARAGRHAAIDVVLQAGAGVFARDVLGARPVREQTLDQVHGLPHGVGGGERPKIAGPVLVVHLPSDVHPGEFLAQINLEIRVGLVVFQAGVVAGFVPLDEGILQDQRLGRRVGDDVLEVVEMP